MVSMKKSNQKPSQKGGKKAPAARARSIAKASTGKPGAKSKAGAWAAKVAAPKFPPVVGVGASAGGLEAFTQLLEALPSNTGMAFVLVQHLEPKHESLLPRLLSRATEMPVHEVRQGMRLEANNVYVIPVNADLRLVDGLLHVVTRKALSGHHLPIDYFFRSLADTRKSRAIGVILSGTASDGTAGLNAIKVEGGVTFAQEPASAKFDGMPRSAIAAGCVDFVLPPERIAGELERIAHHPLTAMLEAEAAEALPAKEADWVKLFRLLRVVSGVDFTFYKKSTIKRRLARRMALHKTESIGEYLKLAKENREELNFLFQDILIHVTGFFRDSQVFNALRDKILPQILATRAAGEPIRIWASGCSSGEEVYSIVICLLEHLGDRASSTPIQVFGTDINEAEIEKARAGVYSAQDMREVSAQRRTRFFTKTGSNYMVNQSVRELCVFARHDVTKDPPFSKIDLLSCRNVLIYFEQLLQRKVLLGFHYALNPTGVLMLGKSESLGTFADLFSITDRKNKFFIKNTATEERPEMFRPAREQALYERSFVEVTPRVDIDREADRFVWERYAHAGIVINNDLQILHFRGDTGPYLRPAPGKANLSLSKMLREELQVEVGAAIREARKSGHNVRRQAIPVGHERQTRTVNVEVCPLPADSAIGKYFLVLFDEATPGEEPQQPRVPDGKRGEKGAAAELKRVQNELERTRQYLQAVVREHKSTSEELKTSNEEALSSMEELQSTNEELETAKEELQSTNEELVTLNDQLQTRNSELSRLSDDLSNVISGVDIPIIILDNDRRIRRFNPAAEKLFGLLAGDIGRPIGNLHIGVNITERKELITSVTEKGTEVERQIQSADGRWYSLRFRPFRTGEQKIEGVLITFMDIDDLKRSRDALQKEEHLVSATLDAAKDLLVVLLDREGRIIQFNRVCQELTGYSLEEVKGRRPWEFLIPADEVRKIKKVNQENIDGKSNQAENHWITKDGRRLLIGWSNSPVLGDGVVESVVATGIDQTRRAAADQRALESEATVRALLETAAQAILAVNREGQIMLANATTEKIFGYKRADLIGQNVLQLVPERFRERHVEHMAKWFEKPRNRRMDGQLELAGLRKDGSALPVEIGLSYIKVNGDIIGVAFVSDITERKRNEKALLDYQRQLQRLSGNLLNIQETENLALGRELHDAFSQELAALGMEISTLLASAEVQVPLTERLAELGSKIRHLADEMHRTSRRLHPAILSELGLEAALKEECDAFSQQTETPVRFTCEKLPAALPQEVSLCLYRITQESLSNIRKYAGAKEVRLQLRGENGRVSLRIEDKGVGFDVDEARRKGGLGLISMEERVRLVNGKLDIRSKPRVGTTVEVSVPLKESAA